MQGTDSSEPTPLASKRVRWTTGLLTLLIVIIAMSDRVPGHPFAAQVLLENLKWVLLALTIPILVVAGTSCVSRVWSAIREDRLDLVTILIVFAGITWVYSGTATAFPEILSSVSPSRSISESASRPAPAFFDVAAVLLFCALVLDARNTKGSRAEGLAARFDAPVKGFDQVRERQVQHVILVAGLANGLLLPIKLWASVVTGSIAILADAAHTLADLADQVVEWLVIGRSALPPGEKAHGRHRFESVAAFVLAMLPTLFAFEVATRVINRETFQVIHSTGTLGLMFCVLFVNCGLATWQGFAAKRLESDVLRAGARHSLVDVVTTLVVVAGWQLAAYGRSGLDPLVAIAICGVTLFVTYGLFKKSVPIIASGRLRVRVESTGETTEA